MSRLRKPVETHQTTTGGVESAKPGNPGRYSVPLGFKSVRLPLSSKTFKYTDSNFVDKEGFFSGWSNKALEGAGQDRPSESFVILFPESLDKWLQPFDDAIIKYVQRNQNIILYYFSLSVTHLTSIESLVVFPFVLYVFNQDEFASYMTCCSLMCSLVSQIPKRFLWRYRPYMLKRAKAVRIDKTSSFPSRAVTGGVIVGYILSAGFNITRGLPVHSFEWWMPILWIILPLSASYSRVYFGVHYPTDCISGVVQGTLILFIASYLFDASNQMCGSCADLTCYDNSIHVTLGSVISINWVLVFSLSALGTALVLLSSMKPIEFWVKCHYIYALVWPMVIFRLAFLCPSLNTHSVSLNTPSGVDILGCFASIAVASVSLVVGWRTRGTRIPARVVTYAFIQGTLLVSLVLLRFSSKFDGGI